MTDSNPEYELNKAITQNIPISVEINGQIIENIDPKEICPWYEPPKKKKTWRRRVTKK